MTNHRLLTGLLAATLVSGGVCVRGQNVRSLTIEQLFDLAETHSTQLRPSFSGEEEARRDIAVSKTKWLPDINANLSVSYIGNGFTTKRNFSDYQRAPIPHLGNALTLNISQPVYTGGAITAGIELSELKSSAARFATDLERSNIRMMIAGYYLDIYKCHNLRSVVQQNIVRAEKVLSEMHARHEQGLVLSNDITRYELLVSNLKLQLVKIDNTLHILNLNLVTTAGISSEVSEILPDSTILARLLPESTANWWQQQAADNSPRLKLASNAVDISKKALTLAKSERIPKIGLQAGWSMDGPILVEVPPVDRNLSYWYVGVGVSYNLSSLFKSNKAIAKSKAATVTAAMQLDAVRENLEMAVHSDYIRYLEAYEELKTEQKSVELAQKNYSTVSTRYSEGMALITDLLDASSSSLDAEQRLVNAKIGIIYSYYKLLFTSGKI